MHLSSSSHSAVRSLTWAALLSAAVTLSPSLLPSSRAGNLVVDLNDGDSPYVLTTGTLSYDDVYVGDSSIGQLVQAGGTLNVTGLWLFLGESASTSGTYNLTGGTLNTTSTYVGGDGTGTFVQGGGTQTVSVDFALGLFNGSGTFNLSGTSTLSVAGVEFIGDHGTGTFNQDSGTNTTGAAIYLARDAGSGTYNLSGTGTLSAPFEAIGLIGTGTFNQTNGTNTINGALEFAVYRGNGTYTLSGGVLQATSVSDGGGTGTFHFNGGTLQAGASNASFFGGVTTADVQAGGAVIDTNGYNVTASQALVSGTASGTPDGGLTKLGLGTLTLSGTNTYTGGTMATAGTLVESNNGNALSTGPVSIDSGATVALSNTSTTASILQAGTTFSGVGTLQKLGAGTVQLGGNGGSVNVSLGAGGMIDVEAGTLVGSSSYQGIYTNNLGSLNIASGATFDGEEGVIIVDALTGAGTLKGGYATSGSVTVGVNNGSGTFSGVIQDSGADGGVLTLIKSGTGTQILTGANTYSGTTTISNGMLQIGSGGTSGSLGNGDIVDNASLVFERSDSLNVANSISGSGTVSQNGKGTLTLSGNNTYGGTTRINSGTLLVNGINSGKGAVNVLGSGSVLGGTGTIAGPVVVENGGDLNPGGNTAAAGSAANVGGLTVGRLSLTSTATVTFDVNTATVFDEVVVNGNAMLGGTLALKVDSGATFTFGQLLDLIHSGGLLTGTFADVKNGGIYSYDGDEFEAIYTSTDFELEAVPEPGTWTLLVCGVGLLGLGWRQRRHV